VATDFTVHAAVVGMDEVAVQSARVDRAKYAGRPQAARQSRSGTAEIGTN
jgi:hypothetical protein